MASPALEAEIRVMLATEKKVLRELSIAYSRISKDLTALQRKQGPSAMLERAQLRRVKTAIKGEMAGMWSRVGNEIRAGRIQAAGAAVGLASEAEKLFRAAGLTSTEIATMQRSMTLSAESSVDAAMRRMQGDSYRPLSDKVYHTQVLVNGQLDRVINQAMLKEANAASLSKAVRGFIRPDTAGGVRYASNRLARTEINNAFHASAVKGMQSEPFTKNVLWNLSGSHARPDVCNDYAEEPHVLGGEAGVWSPMEVPERPHPNCLCFVTAITVSDEEFIKAFSEGKYDDWLKDEIGYEPNPLDRPIPLGGIPVKGSPPKLSSSNLNTIYARENEFRAGADIENHLRASGVLDESWKVDVKKVGSRELLIDVSDAEGLRVFRARRVFLEEDGKRVVEHDLLRVARGHQGTGIATRFNRAMDDIYRTMDVDRLTTVANLDVGGYTWARAGWDWNLSSPDRISVNLDTITEAASKLLRKGLSPSDLEKVKRWGEISADNFDSWPTPFELSRIGWTEGATTWPGKEVMLEALWEGKRVL